MKKIIACVLMAVSLISLTFHIYSVNFENIKNYEYAIIASNLLIIIGMVIVIRTENRKKRNLIS